MTIDRTRPSAAGAKKAGQRKPSIPGVIREHGLVDRWQRGQVAVERGPDPDDPAKPALRARAVCAYDRLHARGGITDPQREAADRYAILREAELGARWTRTAGPNLVRTPHHSGKGHPIHSQVQAAATLRAAHEALGKQARTVVALLVVDNLTVKDIAARLNISAEVGMGLVHAALTRLAEHWGMA